MRYSVTANAVGKRELRRTNGCMFSHQTRRIINPCCQRQHARAVFLVFDRHSIYKRSTVYAVALCYACNATWTYHQ